MRRHALATALVSSLVLAAGVAAPSQGAAAITGEPDPLPTATSVAVSAQSIDGRPTDEATSDALHGDQPAGGPAAEGGGNPSATPLAASATWDVSEHTGDFTWSYPLRVPPAPGGLEPDLSLSYSSGTVDGRTSATNNQPSWVGEGWDLDLGFVERTYGGCADDKEGSNKGQQVGDLCWRSDNATASYSGAGGMLIPGANGWRAKRDDGSRIERLTRTGSEDNDGEYWKITKVDGTQYFFGSRTDANSTWTVPVFGDDEGEPCHGASFDTSSCNQAWRWNLDKIVDRFGNVVLMQYQKETNSYGRNLKDTAVKYDRGGWLDRIDYGLNNAVSGPAAGRVVFGTSERCVPGSDCRLERTENFPDVPLTSRCETATCKDQFAPTFWSTKRLASVTTQVLRGSSYSDVDRWNLDQQFPQPGDGDKAALWLKSITHTGLAGGSITLPPVTFEGAVLANRVPPADPLPPILRYRLTGIVSEAGGVTSVTYAPPDCAAPPTNPESNTKRCFPVRWKKTKDHAERTDYFHKYVVQRVVQSDRISANPQQETSYEYLDGAAWHYDQSEFTPPDKKSWNDYRGYARVRTRTGAANDPAGPVTMTEQRFFRGMNGDRAATTGGTKTSAATDSEGGSYPDHDWLRGFGLETTTYLGDAGTAVDKSISEPVWQGPTASRGEHSAYLVGTGTSRDLVALDEGRGWRTTKTVTAYDDRGLPTQIDDLGDVADPADDTCTRTTYKRNTGVWLLNLPSRIETVAVKCTTTPVFPQHALADVRTSYDEQEAGLPPIRGAVSRVEQLAKRPAAGPEYATVTTARSDVHGRVLESRNAFGKATTVAYTPATGGPATKTVTTNALGHTSTVTVDPAFGSPISVSDANNRVTETAYDALGRVTQVWLPSRPRPASPNYKYAYLVRNNKPNVVTTTTMGPRGLYTSVNAIYDGLLRPRQLQAPAVGGGRLLTDTRYDSQGRVWKSTQPFFNDKQVDSDLWVANDNEAPGLSVTEYDGAGRPVESIFKGGPTEKFRTSTRYGGDRVHVDPPDGQVATTSISDGRGRPVEYRQYHGATPSGAHDVTKYTHTPAGQLATVTDPAGNRWQYGYDLRGRRISSTDPDRGAGTASYDVAGRLISQTDARKQTISYAYDDLGRQTAKHNGSLDGPKLAEWTYDTVAKGMPATATSYSGGKAYRSSVIAFSALYLPLRTTLTVPEGEGALSGTYTASRTYTSDGSLESETYPRAGDLAQESVFHTYDDFGRPLRTYGGGTEYVQKTEYTAYGEQQRIHHGETGKRAWVSTYYDDSTRLVNRTVMDAELPRPMQSDTRYTRNPAGGITSIAETVPGLPDDIQCFRYDHVQRLTEAWTPSGGCADSPSTQALAGPAPYWSSYGYDQAGNRRSEVQHAASGDTTRTYAYPATGQARPHAPTTVTTAGQTTNYTYDAVGNTLTRGAQSLTWTPEGRLDTVTEAGADTTSVYAADGVRLLKREPGATVLYLGGQELKLDKASGKLTATRYYEHSGATVAVRTGAGLSWLGNDHHGTQRLAIDAAAQTVTRRRELPFGAPRGEAPTTFPGQKGFVGGTLDATTGLTHLGARTYDPDNGRFLSVDPLMIAGDPQQLDGYSYAGNSPVNTSDPTGLARSADDHIGHYRDDKWQGQPGVTPDVDKSGKRIKQHRSSCDQDCRVGQRGGQGAAKQSSCNKFGDCRRGVQGPAAKWEAPKKPLVLKSTFTLSLCFGSSVQAFVGYAGEGCWSIDGRGLGHSEGNKTFAGPGAGIAATIGLKLTTTSVDKLEGGETSVGGGELKYGPVAVGGEVGRSDLDKDLAKRAENPAWSYGVSAGPAAGIGGRIKGLDKIPGLNNALGGSSVTAGHGQSTSGYYFRWDSYVQRVAEGNRDAAENGDLINRVHG
ncbi:RHS repeat-associated core domain-containing protein [Kribbella deserti]|uniref:RHS repeat-associated core domain-containing protein n=1 Tax=Kribbella deserti TaxID=1926257 RepID=A0ABV6QF43_9ACTN